MKMTEMHNRLVREGFDVDRRYDSITKEYIFNICKDGVGVTARFKYDGHESQEKFIREIIFSWEKALETVTCRSFYSSIKRNERRYRFIAGIEDVIFNGPATIVKWSDGTKTVVKCCEDDIFDPEKGLAMAISKKALGDLKEVKKWTKKYEAPKLVFDFKCTTTTAEAVENFKNTFRKTMHEVFGL